MSPAKVMKVAILFMIGVALIGAGCSKHIAQFVSQPVPAEAKKSPDFVQGQVVVALVSADDKETLKAYKVEAFDKGAGLFIVKGVKDVNATAKELSANPKVLFAEPNFKLQANGPAFPRDPKWLDLWALKNYGQDSPQGAEGRQGADIGALEAWKLSNGSRQIVVAVIDTGIDYSHPDLRANMWMNRAEIAGLEGVDDDKNGFTDDKYGWDFVSGMRTEPYYGQLGDPDPMDDNNHGTHCAGTIGASGNNQIGIVGVNWEVSLMALKFLDEAGSGSTVDAYRAVKYAADNNADIISASWGGGGPSKLLETAIKMAGEKGVLFVAAAGNDGENHDLSPHYPSGYKLDSVISVAATDNRDQLASFSNFGYESVHIAAPGVAIMSTLPLAKVGEGKEPYGAFSGTSMATPHVAGAAALLLAADPSLRKKPAEIKKRLMDTVDWRPQLSGRVVSGGRLNIHNLLMNKKSVSPMATEGWIEKPYNLSTVRNPTKLVDHAWVIEQPGAVAIQVHVKSSVIDQGFDVAMLYDREYRQIAPIPDATTDVWLPMVLGDKVYLKFANALVKVQKNKETVVPAPVPGALCFQQGTTTTCYLPEGKDEPFANFLSEGIEIDKIRYLPASAVNQ